MVAFEYAPQPKGEYLNDATAFDVFLEFRGQDGKLRFLGIEVKLSEPFSRTRYLLEERPAYQRWVDSPSAPWAVISRDSLDALAHNQLWRDHMLAFALSERGSER